MLLDTGQFYFNQISCFSDMICMAVAEGDTPTFFGASIYGTTDGGESWVNQYTGYGESMLTVRMLSAVRALRALSCMLGSACSLALLLVVHCSCSCLL